MPEQSFIHSILDRPAEERRREYRYRFAQSLVFGIPVIALQWWGKSLGGAEAERWVGVFQGLLAGWVIYVAAAGMICEGALLLWLRRNPTVDFVVAAAAAGLYLYSAISVIHISWTGRLWYRPIFFQWVVGMLIVWNGARLFLFHRR